jgi:hypothetical protein
MHTDLKRRTGLAAAVVAAAWLFVPSAHPQAGPGSTYTDPTGDAAAAADITGVSIQSDRASGQILFRISGINLATNPDQDVELLLDSDANPVTGDVGEFGADYWFGVDDTGYGFQHFDGSNWVDTADSTVQITGGGSTLLISVSKSELGNTSDFNLEAFTWDEVAKNGDDAPDLGTYNYSIDAGGPLITGVLVVTKPQLGPKAGKTFVLTPTALKLPPDGSVISVLPQPDSYTCRASLKGVHLTGAGVGGCSFRLGSKAHGKPLAIVLTVTYKGAVTTFPYRFQVG